MRLRITFIAAALVAGGMMTGQPMAARQELTLSYRWVKGDSLRYRMVQQTDSAITGMPGAGNVNVGQGMTQMTRTSVQDIAADGTATLEQIIDSVLVEMTTPMGTFKYDSTAPAPQGATGPEAMFAKLFSTMIGAPFTIVLTPKGLVQKVEGASRVVEKMAATMPRDPEMAGAIASLRQNFSDEAMKNMLSQAYVQFPDRPVKAGDTWNLKGTIPNPALGPLSTSVDSTLVAIEGTGKDQLARIRTKLTITQTKPQANTMGITAKITGGSGEGELLFDVAKGQVRQATTNVMMPTSMSGFAPDGTAINMKSDVKTTIKLELVQ